MSDVCSCGFPANDPTAAHVGFHKIWEWNSRIFADARQRREAEFDQRVEEAKPAPEPAPALAVGDGASTASHYQRG